MSKVGSSVSPLSKAQPRKAARTLQRLGPVLATLAAVGPTLPAHATYPGENGPIVFTSVSTSPATIARVQPGGTGISTLAQGTSPRVSPNGKKIAFLVGSGTKSVFVMNIDGSDVAQLTSGLNVIAATWLPDGSRLAYVVAAAPNQWGTSLWTMNNDGTDKSYVRELRNGLKFSDLAWSPTTDAFAYSDGNGNLWYDTVSNPYPVTLDAVTYKPSWAPDGASILYGSGSASPFLLKEYSGTSSRTIQQNAARSRTALSPDGTLLTGGFGTNMALTTRARAGTPVTFSWPVATVDADWARVPKNCHATTPQGGGGVLGGYADFYAEQCVIAVSPNPAAAGGVLALAMAIGPDKRVYASALKNDASGAPKWGSYGVVPGAKGDVAGIQANKIAVAAANDGSFQAVMTDAANNRVYHAIQYPKGNWSGFDTLPVTGKPWDGTNDVAIAINGSSSTSPGKAQVLASATGSVYYVERSPNGSWDSSYVVVPGTSRTMNPAALAMASSNDGYTNVLAITTTADGTGQMQQVLRDPQGNWSGWVTVPAPVGTTLSKDSRVAIARTSSQASVMFLDAENRAYFQMRDNPNLASSWQTQLPATLVTTQGRSVSISQGSTSQVLVTRVYPQ
ncbi:hypothetical protein GCM10023165_54220 [Variovorax defluvii]|uniref:WD40 repeat protein n=1 Tax=Variovorax defluvii TaxID=913761 RepID=A0ABP8IHU3_9BURK